MAKKNHLLNYIENEENIQQISNNDNIERFGPNSRQKVDKIEIDSDWHNIPLEDLPYGLFYKIGTLIFIRPVSTAEIEAFSTVNDKNIVDVQLKLNEILAACCKIQFADGSIGTYRDIQDGDRSVLSILIAKISREHGDDSQIQRDITCECLGSKNVEQKVHMIPANYIYKTEDPKLTKWFNKDKRVYEFTLKNGTTVCLAPPTIGLTEDMIKYVFEQATKSEGKRTPNVAFIELVPYIKSGLNKKSMSLEELDQEEYNFTKMNKDLFMFIDKAVKMLNFSIEELQSKCKVCKEDIKTTFRFPSGARALFIIPDAFDEFIG